MLGGNILGKTRVVSVQIYDRRGGHGVRPGTLARGGMVAFARR